MRSPINTIWLVLRVQMLPLEILVDFRLLLYVGRVPIIGYRIFPRQVSHYGHACKTSGNDMMINTFNPFLKSNFVKVARKIINWNMLFLIATVRLNAWHGGMVEEYLSVRTKPLSSITGTLRCGFNFPNSSPKCSPSRSSTRQSSNGILVAFKNK